MRTSRDDSAGDRRHWLCVAHKFPPINHSGTHRTLGFVRHLDRLGWDATVVTVEPRDEPIDDALLLDVPSSTTVRRAPCADPADYLKRVLSKVSSRGSANQRVKIDPELAASSVCPSLRAGEPPRVAKSSIRRRVRSWCSALLTTPDSRIGWIAPAVRAGLDAISRRSPDVIYSTSPCMSAHLVGAILSRWTRVPWVADFRDPWRGNPFRSIESSTIDAWDALLEWCVLRSATHVVCCSPTMTKQLVTRHPFVAGKCSTILNGFDRERFENVEPIRIEPSTTFVLTHCGQFYGPRSPEAIFAALRRVADQQPALAERIRFVLIGAESCDGRSLTDWARSAGVGACVRVLGQMDHHTTLSHMAGSDALLLVGTSGSGGTLQVPNKLFEYMGVRKQIIAMCPPDSPVRAMLSEARAIAFSREPHDVEGLADDIVRLATRGPSRSSDSWSGVDRFDRCRRAAELLEIFERISRHGPGRDNRILRTATAARKHAPPGGITPADATAASGVAVS